MLPAVGLVAEALTIFICGLYTGFRWANRNTVRFLEVLPELSVVCGIAAVSWLIDSFLGLSVASGMVAAGVFFLAFGGFHPSLSLFIPSFAGVLGLSVAALSGDDALGLLLWESVLVVPAAVYLLIFPAGRSFRRNRLRDSRFRDLAWTRFWKVLPLLGVLVLVVELFLYRRGTRGSSVGISVLALGVTLLLVGGSYFFRFRSEAETVSGFLALGVLHEYRKLLGRLQLLAEFGARNSWGLEAAEGYPDPLGLISSEVRFSAASLGGLDALYGRESMAPETRIPGDVEAVLRLAGPVFRQSGRHLELELETGLVIAAPPGVVLHSLLILLRNVLDHAAPGSPRVLVSWSTGGPRGEAVLRVLNGVEPSGAAALRQPGWGRGLRIVRGVARQYGGKLDCRRSGSRFSAELRFPLSKSS